MISGVFGIQNYSDNKFGKRETTTLSSESDFQIGGARIRGAWTGRRNHSPCSVGIRNGFPAPREKEEEKGSRDLPELS